MAVLLDTNILLRLVQPHHPQNSEAARALRSLRGSGEALVITQQNIIEFWVVTTRPAAANGLGWTAEQAGVEVASLRRLFFELPELPLQNAWEQLVQQYSVTGKSAHDARLVAAMVVHSVRGILTFNAHDFTRYREIAVLEPAAIV